MNQQYCLMGCIWLLDVPPEGHNKQRKPMTSEIILAIWTCKWIIVLGLHTW